MLRFLVVIPFLLLIFSCKKDERVLDGSVMPDTDLQTGLNSESFPVTAFTEKHDSIYSFNGPMKFLGTNIDPVFGRIQAGLYLNANFSEVGLSFGPDPQLIKAEFVFVIVDPRYGGSRDAALTFSVFPLDSALNTKRVYHTTVNNLHNTSPLATMPVAKRDTMRGITLVRIPLDSAFARDLIRDQAALTDIGTFQAKYPGFYIAGEPPPGQEGVIHVCDLDEPQSGLFFYFAPDPGSPVDTVKFHFTGDRAVRFNSVKHDHSGGASGLVSQLAGSKGDPQHLYVQGLGGTRVFIDLPVASQRTDSFKVAVNRAELILKVDPSTVSDGYDPPGFLSLLPISASGRDTLANDQYNVTDVARYGGSYDKSKQQYVFNIARHVQAILNGERVNRGFRLVVAHPDRSLTFFRDDNFERVVLGGTGNAAYKPVFRLTYSKLQGN